MAETNRNVSNNVIRRLPRYLRKLDELHASGLKRVSSADLGSMLGLTPSQIRQDLNSFGGFGQQGYGYNIADLRRELADILGMNHHYKAILVGVGNMGLALIHNFSFEECGFTLECGFDINPEIIGKTINNIPIYADVDMAEYLSNNEIDVAVLCVPRRIADVKVQELKTYGVRAIWNYTNVDIDNRDKDLIIENMNFPDSLLALEYYITERRRREEGEH